MRHLSTATRACFVCAVIVTAGFSTGAPTASAQSLPPPLHDYCFDGDLPQRAVFQAAGGPPGAPHRPGRPRSTGGDAQTSSQA